MSKNEKEKEVKVISTEERLLRIEATLQRVEDSVNYMLEILNDVYPEEDEAPYPDDGHVDYYVSVPVPINADVLAEALKAGKAEYASVWKGGQQTSIDIVPVKEDSVTLAYPVLDVLDTIVRHSGYFHPTVKQLATLSNYSMSEPFKGFIKALRDTGMITVDNEQVITPTDKGIDAVKRDGKVPFSSPHQALKEWYAHLGKPLESILEAIIEGKLDKESYALMPLHQIALKAGYDKRNPTFKNYLSKLKGNGLIEIVGDTARVTPALFMNLL